MIIPDPLNRERITDSVANRATTAGRFSDAEINAVYKVIALRRDIRHFRAGCIPEEQLSRLLEAARQAPSVGFMQPWRFIRITNPTLRRSIHALVEDERVRTARALGKREDEFMRLKVEGMLECAEVLVAALMDGREQHVFGRRTLPEIDLASVACAIQNLWLAARAEGVGMGWVSLFDPVALAVLLGIPEGARPIAVLCLGPVEQFYDKPMLESEGWAKPQPLCEQAWENGWQGEGQISG